MLFLLKSFTLFNRRNNHILKYEILSQLRTNSILWWNLFTNEIRLIVKLSLFTDVNLLFF